VSESTAGARHAALAVVSRRRLLEVLQSADGPLAVAQLAEVVGLHVTTARFHLDILERVGLVRRVMGPAGGPVRPGRPRQLYAAAVAPEATEGHRQLAAVFAGVLAADADKGPRWAEQAGRRWAEEQVPADDDVSWDEGTRRVEELFDRLGFAPRLVDRGPYRHLELGGCPFRDLARAYPQVVCSVHLGLLREALQRLGIPSAAQAGLRPFVEPELCIADVPIPPGGQEARCPTPVC